MAIGIVGDMEATVLMLFTPETAAVLCPMLGVEAGTEIALSAMQEIGNVLGASYTGALGMMTGLELEPVPPQAAHDMLGAIVASVLLAPGEDRDVVLLLDSDLTVEGGDGVLAVVHVHPVRGRRRRAAVAARAGLGT